MTSEELKEVEKRVNEQVWANTKVETMIKSIAEARAMGAMALFGEKYGEVVRVVRVGDYSLELCGGTHVRSTGEIGLFKIISESGIGSGIRRIEAATGKRAFAYLEQLVGILQEVAQLFKSSPQDLTDRILQLQDRVKELSRDNESLRSKLNRLAVADLLDQVQVINGVPFLSAQVEAGDMDSLRNMMDDLRQKQKEGVILLGAVTGDKVQLVASVSPEYVKLGLHAGKLIKEVATICGGGGGGRPDMAQAGGKQPEKLPVALQQTAEWIRGQVKL
jgi:alanyl-tRNA synthetase